MTRLFLYSTSSSPFHDTLVGYALIIWQHSFCPLPYQILKCFWIGLEEDKIEDNTKGKCLAIRKLLNLECLQESLIKLVQESSFLVLTSCGSKILDTIL